MSATDRRGPAGTRDASAQGDAAGRLTDVGEVPYRAMIEGMLEGVAFLDREWRFLYVNDAGAANLGASREELLGKSVFDHYPGLRGSPLHERFASCLEGGQGQRFEAPFTGADGGQRWFEFSVQPTSTGVLVLSLDVSERHEAADLDARLRAAFESIDFVAVILDPEGRVLFANEALSRTTGWPREGVLGTDWFNRFVPEDLRAAERASFDAALRGGETPRQREHDMVTRSGERRTIVWSRSVLRDRSGAVTAVAAVGDDVTDRRALAKAFRDTSRSVSAALNASEDSIAIYRPVLDAHGKFADAEIVFANSATGKWLPHIDLAAARGRRLFELAPEARPSVSEIYTTVVETGRPVHVVRESRLLPGPLVLDITVTPYEDGFVHVARDVTELHRTTAELREREEELRRTLGAVDAILAWTSREDGPLTVSPQVERILGWRPEELTAFAAWNALVHPDDRAACREQWDSDEDSWRLQYRIRRVDGSYAVVDDRGRRYIGISGERGTFGVIVDVSERVAADAALADSEERLREIVEGVEAIVGFQAAEGAGLQLSPQIERILGWAPEQIPDLASWRALVHPDDLPRCLEVWQTELPDWQLEYRVRRADGTWAWMVDRGRKGARKDGPGSYMFEIMVDATVRHQADEALRASEERQRRTIEGLDGIVATQEHAGAPVICSPQMERILGIDPATVTSFEAWRRLVHPDDLARCMVLWDARPEQWEIEYRMRRPDGRDVWVLDRGRRIPREDGLGEGTFGIIVDVTDRHAAAEALRASEEQLRRMVEGVDVMISYQESEDAPVIISPQTERILGYPPERMADFDEWRAAIHPDDLPACIAMWDSGSPGWDMQYRMRRADGAWIWVNDRGRRIPRPDGSRGLFGVITDITAERELGEQLRRSQRLEAVGQLAGGVAHDFNNLLAAIRGYGELAMDGLPQGSPARADIEEVLRAADRAAALTRQLLLFSRREVLAPKLVDPADVVDGLFPMLRQLVGEHIELVATNGHQRGLVLADPGQLEQVILNLVVNARDAMPGGGRIEVLTTRLEAGSEAPGETAPPWPALRIMVADTGSGIDAEALPHIFEPFFTTKEAGRGSGMGLATVYGIVGASSGTVSVATAPGKGTTFTIDLPLVEGEGVPEDGAAPVLGRATATGHVMAAGASAATPPVGDVPDGRRGSALLVEDDPAVRALLARMLGALGWRVAERSSGNAVLTAVAGRELAEPDLLVTDVRMPGLQGPDLARRLRATWPALPVLFITGLADEVGADPDEPWMHVLTKPFDLAELRRSIEATLAEHE